MLFLEVAFQKGAFIGRKIEFYGHLLEQLLTLFLRFIGEKLRQFKDGLFHFITRRVQSTLWHGKLLTVDRC